MKNNINEKALKKSKNKNVKTKSEGTRNVSELRERIKKEQDELIRLMLEKTQYKLKNTSSIRTKKDQIARLLTALNRIELEANI